MEVQVKFLLLLTGADEYWDRAGEAERAELLREVDEFQRRHAGRMVGGGALAPAAQARAVRRRAGIQEISDGPYGETKEVVGGFIVIEADDLDAAVAVAEEWPSLPGASGGVEVREIVN
ncbi:MAG TPA: YciI family protein [Planosporangium sp.]|nr:YciI family protein [Planosporangium sp.]